MKTRVFLAVVGIVIVALIALLDVAGIILRKNALSQDFRLYFGAELPQIEEAKAVAEPAVTRELFKARFELEHTENKNLSHKRAKLGERFYDMCITAKRAGFEKEVKAADCPAATQRG